MRPVTLLQHEISSRQRRPIEHDDLRALLSLVLEYRYSPAVTAPGSPIPGGGHDQRKTLSRLASLHLQRDFFDKIFVANNDADRLAEELAQTSERVMVITGEKGTGKTTTLLRLVELLRTRAAEGDVLAYYDVYSLRHRLRSAPRTERFDLCNLVFADLYTEVVAPSGMVGQWRRHLVETEAMFASLRLRLAEDGDLNADNATDTFRELVRSRVDDYNREVDSVDRLIALVTFLRRLNRRVVLVLDNVDQYPIAFQAQVATHLHDIVESAGLDGAFLAMRDESYRRARLLIDSADRIHPIKVERLDPRAFAFFQEFLRRRLRYLHLLADDLEIRLPQGNTQDLIRMLEGLTQTGIDSRTRDTSVLSQLLEWCNGSLRAAATTTVSLFESILDPHDALFSSQERRAVSRQLNFPAGEQADLRSRRTAVLRHICVDNPLRGTVLGAPALYRSGQRSGTLPLLDLHLLWHLERDALLRQQRERGSGVTVDHLYQRFSVFGVTLEATVDALDRLRDVRGGEDRGLVHGDHMDEDGNLLPDAEIWPLRSATFMLDRLATTCEYAFWCALFDQRGDELVADLPRLPSRFTLDSVRIDVALNVLEERVLEPLDSWLAATRQTHALGVAYREMFGDFGVPSWFAVNLRRYAQEWQNPRDRSLQRRLLLRATALEARTADLLDTLRGESA